MADPMTAPAHAAPTSRQMAVMDLIHAADGLRRYFTEFYQPHGIAPQQYNVLRILRGARPHGLPTMDIADRMVEKTPGITRLIDRLEDKGLVQRKRAPDDRRQVVVSISSAGLSLLDELEEPVRDATEAALAMLSADEVEQLRYLLGRIGRR
jgi:DNA-binding MarR family transcriptional regulator